MSEAPTLAEIQALFWRLITAPEGVAAALSRPQNALDAALVETTFKGDSDLSVAERLGVYSSMYFNRLIEALEQDFPKLLALLGHNTFHELIRDYLDTHPSRSASLRHVGRHLAAFLSRHPLDFERPELAELASFEWALLEAFDAPDAEPLTPEELRAVPPERWPELLLEPVPSFRLLVCAGPVHKLWTALDRGEPVPVYSPDRYVVRVWREGFDVVHAVVEDCEEAGLRALSERRSLEIVCRQLAEENADPAQAARQAFEVLGRWLGDGMVCRQPTDGIRTSIHSCLFRRVCGSDP